MRIQERGLRKRAPQRLQVLDRVREWTRLRFTLSDETTVLVSEIACALPGCPPLETVIAFWENEQRYHFKIFKPVAEVVADDLPFAWQKESLAVPADFVCDCC
jgi:nitrate reductase delta subunit